MFLRLAAIIVVGVLVCLWLAHYITSPVLKLQGAAREIAAGKLNTRVGCALGGRRDEIAALGHDFDHMAEHIENLMNVQRRLLQAISHELRSPLARMNVAVGIGRQHSGQELQGSWDRIQKETDRLNAMISQILTLARLEKYVEVVETGTQQEMEMLYTSPAVEKWFYILLAKLEDGVTASFHDISQIKQYQNEFYNSRFFLKIFLPIFLILEYMPLQSLS